MAKILEVTDLHYYYGDIHAIKGVNLDVEEGEIVALIGSNGVGKTTTLRCISGLLDNIARGNINFVGKTLNKIPPHIITSLGLSQVLEGRHIFSQLTVKENIMQGAYLRKGSEIQKDLNYVYQLFPILKEREKQLGGTLSGGEQQMLAIARVLMSKPKLILMDEPSLGLAPILVKEIFQIIKRINENGISILLVEQNCKASLNIAHRGYVMETGEVVLSGDAKSLLNNEQVKKSYLGE